jgi:hypothetical protein
MLYTINTDNFTWQFEKGKKRKDQRLNLDVESLSGQRVTKHLETLVYNHKEMNSAKWSEFGSSSTLTAASKWEDSWLTPW